MELYILTLVNTRIEFDCETAIPFLTLEAAQEEMKTRIENIKKANGDSVEVEEIGNWYATISIGGNRAYFNIIRTDLTLKEMAIHRLTKVIVNKIGVDCFGRDLLSAFLDECSESNIKDMVYGDEQDAIDFFNYHIIGECLYQNAAEKLGGKVDMVNVIYEFFNEDSRFIDISKDYTDDLNREVRWYVGMCEICKGNQSIIQATREAIDANRTDKVFFDYEEAKKQFCQNHRQLSDKLSDSDYMSVCEQICGIPFQLETSEHECCFKMVENLYFEFYKRLYELAKKKGINVIIESFPSIFEVREDFPVNSSSCEEHIPQLVIVGDAFETANAIDTMENHISFNN